MRKSFDGKSYSLFICRPILDFNTSNAPTYGDTYITADIARYGKDRTVIGLWDGYDLKEVLILEKKSVTEVAEEIRNFSINKGVPRSRIIVDEDGIGGGVKDILIGSQGFIANSQPYEGNFRNLKAQCSYKLADVVNSRQLSVSAGLSEQSREEFIEDLGWVKSKNPDRDTKKQILPKDEIIEHLGRSPDFGDMVMMRMWFEVAPRVGVEATQSYTPNFREFRKVKVGNLQDRNKII